MIYFQDYILEKPSEAQSYLMDILLFVHKMLPNTEPQIYHGIPTFFWGKHDVINIGAYKDHIGVHVGYEMVDYLKQKYPSYTYTKSTIQFPYTQALPMKILDDICAKIKASFHIE